MISHLCPPFMILSGRKINLTPRWLLAPPKLCVYAPPPERRVRLVGNHCYNETVWEPLLYDDMWQYETLTYTYKYTYFISALLWNPVRGVISRVYASENRRKETFLSKKTSNHVVPPRRVWGGGGVVGRIRDSRIDDGHTIRLCTFVRRTHITLSAYADVEIGLPYTTRTCRRRHSSLSCQPYEVYIHIGVGIGSEFVFSRTDFPSSVFFFFFVPERIDLRRNQTWRRERCPR